MTVRTMRPASRDSIITGGSDVVSLVCDYRAYHSTNTCTSLGHEVCHGQKIDISVLTNSSFSFQDSFF